MMHSTKAAALCLLAVLAAQGCAKAGPEAPDGGPRVVRAFVVKEEEHERSLESYGTITYKNNIELSAAVEGTVEYFQVKEGERVRAGQLLARLKNMQLALSRDRAAIELENAKTALSLAEARVKEADLSMEAKFIAIDKAKLDLEQKRKNLAEAERKLADQVALRDVGGVPDETIRDMQTQIDSLKVQIRMSEQDLESLMIGFRDKDLLAFGRAVPTDPEAKRRAFVEINTIMVRAELDAARARVRTSEMELESANLALGELEIRSPVAGVVGAKYYEVGERAKASEKVVTIMDTEVVYAIFPVREDDVGGIARGTAVSMSVDAAGGAVYAGVVDVVSPSADPSVGAFMVKAVVSRPDARVKPGMFARVTVLLGAKESQPTVPIRCLLNRREDKATVQTIVGGKIVLKEVTLGKEYGQNVGIVSGIAAGEVLVESPDPTLQEGSDVEIAR